MSFNNLVVFGVILSAFISNHSFAAGTPQTLSMPSTAIVSNYDRSCTTKGTDTETLINNVVKANPALAGQITQASVVTDAPTQVYDNCATSTFLGYQNICTSSQVCDVIGGGGGDRRDNHGPSCHMETSCIQQPQYQCQGGYVTQDNYTCVTNLTLMDSDYVLTEQSANTGNLQAQANAAISQSDVVYSETDGNAKQARWVTVSKKP